MSVDLQSVNVSIAGSRSFAMSACRFATASVWD